MKLLSNVILKNKKIKNLFIIHTGRLSSTKVISIPRVTCLGRESNPGFHGGWEASTLAKNYPNNVLIAIWNIYI
jgi:hypothetical protein